MTSPTSDVNICNMALQRVGMQQQILSLNPAIDPSGPAAVCQLWYPQCRDELLRAWTWPFTRTEALLTQVAGPEINNLPAGWTWLRSYRYPVDALFIRRLFFNVYLPYPPGNPPSPPLTPVTTAYPLFGPLTTHRKDGQPKPPPFALGADAIGTLILTDLPSASAEYTQQVTDATRFPADFASLLAWRIAMDICQPLSRSLEWQQMATKNYMAIMTRVQANALNEQQSDTPWMNYQAEAVRGRFSGGA